MPQTQLSEILRVERARRDLGLVEASKEIGINKETLARLEKGLGNPYYPTIKRLADYYGFPVQDLLVASTIEESDEEVEEGDSPKASAPTSSGQVQDEVRRAPEIDRWIEFLEDRADAWSRQAEAEDNHRLDTWQAALAWDSDVASEAYMLFEATEAVVEGLVKGEDIHGAIDPADLGRDPDDAHSFAFTASGEAAQALQRLEETYNEIWAARAAVGRRVGAVLDRFAKQQQDTASIERARQNRAQDQAQLRKRLDELQSRRGA